MPRKSGNNIDITDDGWDDRDWERTTDCFWCGEIFSSRRAKCPDCGAENYK